MPPRQNFISNEGPKPWADIMKDRCLDYFSEEHQSSVPDNQEHHPSGPCVFEVPKKLLDTKPDAYTPKNFGLGPYHHRLSDLKQTPNQKLEALKSLLENEDVNNFIRMVERCSSSLEQDIRLCYDGDLVLNGESLAWIVIIDSIFLLHSIQPNSREQAASSNELFVLDLLKLENQIPICLMRHVEREFHRYHLSIPSEKIVNFCLEHSPFPMTGDEYSVDEAFGKSDHMLDIMYQLILGRGTGEGDRTELVPAAGVNCLQHWCGLLQYSVSEGKGLISKVIDGLLSAYEGAKEQGVEVSGISDKFFKLVKRLKSSSSFGVKKKHFPSVSQLHQVAQIKFARPRSGFGLRAVACDEENKILYLPVMKLGANSEVILRNLMAYEAKSSKPGSEVIDFLEFMCKIIKDQNDVKILRSATIIERSLLDKEIAAPIREEGGLQDEEIVELFNNLEKAIENTDRKKSNSIFSAIVDKLNKLFNNEGLVKTCGCLTNCVDGIFKLLTLLSPIFMVVLFFFEIFGRRRGSLSFEPFGEVGRGDRHPFGKASVLSLEAHAELTPARKFLRY